MAIEVFNRQELKFVISLEQLDAMMPTILEHMRLDKHNVNGQAYRLYNLYVDTPDFALIRHSMAKPTAYKEKLRIRSYEPLTDDSIVFLEVKKRYKKITNKRRTKIRLDEALRFIATGAPPSPRDYMNQQVVDEMSVMLQKHRYQPTTYIRYDRHAFHALDPTSDLRITFDTSVISRRYNTDETNQLLPSDKRIMEIKSCYNMPMWLANLLDENDIRKMSFSKYGTEYTRILTTKQRGDLQYA